MLLPVPKFYLAVFLICIGVILLRSLNFREQFRFIPDNGLEYAITRQMNLDRCFPLVGPALSIPNVYIPPTYFYYLYLITGEVFTPVFSGYLSSFLKILTVVFLASTVWIITNRRFFLASLIVLTGSWLLFSSTRFMWHPFPVNLFLSISIFLLVYAKLRRRWQALAGAFLTYWLATSIYPSPIILLPWYLYEICRWPTPPQRQWWKQTVVGIGLFFALALPFYLPQIIFEVSHHWPTVRTLQQVIVQPAAQSASNNPSSLSKFYHFLLVEILFLRDDKPGFKLASWFVLLGTLVLSVVSIRNRSHRWHFYFPYLPGIVLISLFLVLNFLLPGQLHQHWLSLFFIILVPAAFEAVYKLWHLLPIRVLSLLLCAVIWISNVNFYWESVVAPPPVSEQLTKKIQRMEHLKSFWIQRDIRPKSILLLDRTDTETSYTDTFVLQYAAMENWTLLHYQNLIPPISPACNEYVFFEKAEIQKLAKNIFLLELKSSPPSPDLLFEVFQKKFSFDLDETVRVVWYVSTIMPQK